MKKIVYMAPEMEIVELKIQTHMLESSGGDGQGSSAGGSGSFDENEDLG